MKCINNFVGFKFVHHIADNMIHFLILVQFYRKTIIYFKLKIEFLNKHHLGIITFVTILFSFYLHQINLHDYTVISRAMGHYYSFIIKTDINYLKYLNPL